MLDFLRELVPSLNPRDLLLASVDILIVAYLIYRVLLMIRGTRAAQMITGMVFIGLGFLAARQFEFSTISWLLDNVLSYVIILSIVVFQDDIRRALMRMGRRVFLGYTALLMLGLLAAAWRWSPLSDWMNVNALVDAVRAFGQGPTGSLVMLGGFLVGGVLAVPITVLIVVTILAFGPLVGAPSALAGALLSAVTVFGLGRALGRYRVQRFAGRRVAHLSRRIAQRGFWAILIVRLLPVAPFSMVNLVAGATSLSLRDFMLGTALGMSPGIVLMIRLTSSPAI